MIDSAIQLSNEFLLQVLALSKDATAIYISHNLHIQFVNDAMLAIWGKDRSVIGKTFEEAIPEIAGQPFTALLQNVWKTGKTFVATDMPADLMINGKLQTSFFDFEYRAIKNEAGETVCILHTATDVTERLVNVKLLEEKVLREEELADELAMANEELATFNEELTAINEEMLVTNEELNNSMLLLAESQGYLRSIMEQAPIGMCVLKGPNMIIELANDIILKIWGRKSADVIGKPHRQARPELEGQTVSVWLNEAYATGKTKINPEFRVMLYDNGGLREAYVNSIYQPLKNSRGEVTSIVVILEEVTSAVKARLEAERAQEMFNLAIEAGELGTFYYNPTTNLFTGNELLKLWFGLAPDDEFDLNVAINVIAEEDRENVTNAIRHALKYESGGVYDIEYTIINPHTLVPRIVRAKGKTLFGPDEQAISLNGTVQDITERKQDDQRKNDFIGMVSHELKTPLTSINAYVQLLHGKAAKNQDNFATNALDKTRKQVKKMTTMINGFLNVSRLESGKIHIDKQCFDMEVLVKEIEEESLTTISSHKVVFAPVEKIMVVADRDKIGQVIQNFISNAVKYSPMGSTIHIACVTENGLAQVSVTDEGMGIKPGDKERLFERYYRVKGEHMKAIAGFGIGLYLCAEIINRHKGSIWVESELGEGSTFYFNLPVES